MTGRMSSFQSNLNKMAIKIKIKMRMGMKIKNEIKFNESGYAN